MSVCVLVRSQKTLTPDSIFEALTKHGEKLVVTSSEFPSLKFGIYLKALRGIEINLEEEGYEVRVCSHASVEDYQLFRTTIEILKGLTGCKAYLGNEEDEEVLNCLEVFNDEWIERKRLSCMDITRGLTKATGHPIVMYGLFSKFCLGAKMYNSFHIGLSGYFSKEAMDALHDYLCSVQWHFANKRNTDTNLVISSSNKEDDRPISVSLISISDGKVDDFDYISEASVLGIVNEDQPNEPPVLIPFSVIGKILPKGAFKLIDEWQYEKVGTLTVDMVRQMMKQARYYQPKSLGERYSYPGRGFSENQNTIILTWDEGLCEQPLVQHNRQIVDMLAIDFSWEVSTPKQAKLGDRFFLVKRDHRNTGIVMSGILISHPYPKLCNDDSLAYFVDLRPNVMLNPVKVPTLSIEQLKDDVPAFDWENTPSGTSLCYRDARTLEMLWSMYLDETECRAEGAILNVINPR